MNIDVLAIFNSEQIQMQKDAFVKAFSVKCNEERVYCNQTGTTPMMTQRLYDEVLNLVRKCGNAYQVEALEEFVLRKYEVPEWNHIEGRANEMMTKALT